ncbi:zinc finger protein 286A-like [Eriocheir sinensis]|uniref:zinc finger protein 286A-like n=1 Tax=Eriocheir sinensis TaxID=95602 RepID=UPI0021C8D1A8|nr:zinc finger protein 286A-like [Eriocheir sinensis]XP_050708366.1 zinc finger protein 286A-like [Eriocheir sinensis]
MTGGGGGDDAGGGGGDDAGGGGGGGGYQEPPARTKNHHQQQQEQKQEEEGSRSEDDTRNAPSSNDLKPGVPCLTCGCVGATISIYTRIGNAEALLTLLALALRQPVGSVMLPSYVVCSECHENFKLIFRLMSKLTRLARKTVLGYNKTLRSLGKKPDVDVDEEDNEECLLVLDGVDVDGKEGGIVGRALAMGSSAVKSVPVTKAEKERRFECPVCGKKFRAYSHRVEHMLVHTGERAFHCTDCGFQTTTKSNLTRHRQRHKEEFRCQLCGKTLGNKFSLKEHLRTHGKDRPHECKHCRKTFLRRRELRVHERGHGDTGSLDAQNHECPECHKRFVLRSRLQRHSLIHKSEREFICETCDKRFVRKDDLKCHERTHSGVKPYTCDECGRAFRFMSNCRSHMKVHLRSSLTCLTCNMSFPTQGKYATHLKSRKHRKKRSEENEEEEEEEEEVMVSGMDEVSCGACGLAFGTLEQLSSHTLSTHISQTILPAPPDTSIIISGGPGGGIEAGEDVEVMSLDGVSVVVAVGGGESAPLPLTLPHPSPPSSALLVGGDGPPPPSPTFPFGLDSKGEEAEGVEGAILNSFTGGEGETEVEGEKAQHRTIITASSTSSTTASTPRQKVTVFKLSEWETTEYYEK